MLMIMLLSWGSVLSAQAEGTGTKEDPYVFESGNTYTVEAYKSFYGKFTAESDGTFTITNTNYSVYTDETFTTINEDLKPEFGGNYNNKTYSFNYEGGKTYYVGNNFLMQETEFTVTFGNDITPIEMMEVSPETGGIFDAGKGLLNITFNQNVSISSATMAAGTVTESVIFNVHGAYALADVKDKLNELYENGSLKENDDIVFKLEGVAPSAAPEALYNGTGIIELAYKAGPKPMRLTSMTNLPGGDPEASTFYSYYMSDDASGVITMTFSDDINLTENNKPIATLGYGNTESEDPGEYYTEPLEVKQLGNNTLMLNLKGKLRRPQDMVTSGTNYGYMLLRVTNVRDKNGNYAYSDGQGTLGSYSFQYKYEEVGYTADTDWELSNGGNVIDGDTKSVSLWINEEGKKATFGGVEFRYISDGTEQVKAVPMSSITVSEEGTERTIDIPVPEFTADAGTDITVALTSVERPDGLTTEEDPTAMDKFKATFQTTGKTASELEITSAVWHNGTEDINMIGADIAVLTAGTSTTLTTNKDSEIGYAEWEIRGPQEAPENGYVRQGYLSATDGNGFTINWYGETLYAGYDYTMTLKAWKSEADKQGGADPNVGEASFVIHGTKVDYIYSDATLNTDISEDFALTSASENTKVIEFSAPVSVTAVVNLGMGTSQDCVAEQTDEEGKVWNITIPQEVMLSMEKFDVNVFAKDAEGKAVNKTANGLGTIMGSGDNTWFELHFIASYNIPDFTIEPADGAELESISTITFGYANGISINWGGTTEPITIYNKGTREIVATFTQDDVVFEEGDDWWSAPESGSVTLATPITEAGSYTVNVPQDFFMLGTDMQTSTSKATTANYIIKGSETPADVTISPEAGEVTEIPERLTVTFAKYETVSNLNDPTLTDENGNSYPVHFEYGIEFNQLDVILDNGAITAAGTYTLTIPVGAVELGDPDNVNTEEIVFVYVIGIPDSINSIIGTENGKANVYSINGTLLLHDADATAIKALSKGLYIINGKKVVIK